MRSQIAKSLPMGCAPVQIVGPSTKVRSELPCPTHLFRQCLPPVLHCRPLPHQPHEPHEPIGIEHPFDCFAPYDIDVPSTNAQRKRGKAVPDDERR